MKIQFTIDRFENDKVVLVDNFNNKIILPKNKINADFAEGDILNFQITKDQEVKKEKEELAKKILNEILDN